MQLRLSARLLATAGALVLVTSLSSCGFDYATDRVYTQAAGTNDRDASVDVLNAVVVAESEGSGAFVASFANNDVDSTVSVDSLTPDQDDLSVEEFSAIEIGPGELVNLATADEQIVVTGDFGPGDFVSLTVGISTGETVAMSVPVVPPCEEFAGLAPSAEAGDTGSTGYECDVAAPATDEH